VSLGDDDSPSGGDRSRDDSREVEDRLTGTFQFAQLEGATSADCTPGGEERGGQRYTCRVEDEEGNTLSQEWLFFDGEIGRISDGGEQLAPPDGSDDAEELVAEVVEDRGNSGVNVACIPDQGVPGNLRPNPDEYDCHIASEGVTVVEAWGWHDNGSVATEQYEDDSLP
jgi:hypothetical protein